MRCWQAAESEEPSSHLPSARRYDAEHSYQAVASPRLGRSDYQEQYVFVYR